MNEAELKIAYEKRIPALRALGDFVVATISAEVKKAIGNSEFGRIFQIQPKARVKEIDSFLEKSFIRKTKKDPLNEISDQVGVRFVVLLLEDIEIVGNALKKGPWKYRKDRDFEGERLSNPDYFAYQSDHYVVNLLNKKRIKGLTIPTNLSCEIQIRTILQHAYAEMAHRSSYKPKMKLPDKRAREINRSLAKGSALIETTDEVFKEVKVRLDKHNESISRILKVSRDIYINLVGDQPHPSNSFALLVVGCYREFLLGIGPDDLRRWAEKHRNIGLAIKVRRSRSIFYRDSVLILLALLIERHELSIPGMWPVESSFLEDFYRTLGYSTTGIF